MNHKLAGSNGRFYPFDRGKHLKVVVELRAYGDESGTHENPPYCLVAGWIGSPRQWRLFEDSWNEVLHEYSISEFHSTDFFNRKHNKSSGNPYRDWDDARSQAFLNALSNIVIERRIFPIGGAVDVKAFMSYSEGERRYLTSAQIKQSGKWVTTGAPTRPYQLAFPLFLTEAAQAAKGDAVIQFVLDQNNNEAPYAI